MNVLIIETEHSEVISTLIKLFSFNNNRITCIVSNSVQEKLTEIFGVEQTVFTPAVIPAGINRFKTFYFFQKIINNTAPGLIFLSTVSNNHLLFAFLLRKNKTIPNILTVHDINCLFPLKPGKGLKNFLRFTGKKWLVKTVQAFNVITDTMVNTLREKLHNKKAVHNIPGAVYSEKRKFIQLQQSVKLAIPGTIDAKRRNYNEVIELLQLAEKNNYALEIYLAGAYNNDYGYEIEKAIKKLDLKKCLVTFYSPNGLPQNDFEECLENAHFIYMPCVVHTSICPGIQEVYGATKSSGNISDAIQFAKPFIAPAALKISGSLQSGGFKYNSTADILSFLSSILQNPALYSQLCSTAVNNAQAFTVERVRVNNPAVFNNTLP
jgi:hypothetical protein